MKSHSYFQLAALLACLGWMLVSQAQTFTTLYSFSPSQGANTDGFFPWAGLTLWGSTLYGTTEVGGTGNGGGGGTVFSVNTDGSGFNTLYTFSPGVPPNGSNSDGREPRAKLALSGNTLYGTTTEGGGAGSGTVFAINSDGSGFTTLYSFSATSFNGSGLANQDGAYPFGVVVSGNTLYGTCGEGGSGGSGTLFAVNTDGTGFTVLYTFSAESTNSSGRYTNSDGGSPWLGGLTLSSNKLYGTTDGGGIGANGTVFALNIDGTGFTTLYSFSAYTTNSYTNSDGAGPNGDMLLSGNTLYGTTSGGGTWGSGTAFKINIDGSGFATLHSFSATTGLGGSDGTNSDGQYSLTGLILSGNTLYGTAYWGGSSGVGTVFAVNTDGSSFTTVHNFTSGDGITNLDGFRPAGLLTLSSNVLYGTAEFGGTGGSGTIFSIALPITPPQLTITPAGPNVVLAWPTNTTGFTLQSATNLVPPAVWTTVSSTPVVVNGLNTVTNPISGTHQFYRLAPSTQ